MTGASDTTERPSRWRPLPGDPPALRRHQPGSCPLLAGGGPGPDTASNGAAKARERLGLTSKNDAKEGS